MKMKEGRVHGRGSAAKSSWFWILLFATACQLATIKAAHIPSLESPAQLIVNGTSHSRPATWRAVESTAASRPGRLRSLLSTSPGSGAAVFNVLRLGAKGHDRTDDTYAFLKSFQLACSHPGGATVYAPPHLRYRVLPISITGPCAGPLTFQVDGVVVAPPKRSGWPSPPPDHWFKFTNISAFTIQGVGKLDGRGWTWWQPAAVQAAASGSSSRMAVESLRVQASGGSGSGGGSGHRRLLQTGAYQQVIKAVFIVGCQDVAVRGIEIRNSPFFHLVLYYSQAVLVENLTITAPGNSPNTDGIHIEECRYVMVRNTRIAVGDDCVSIQTGTSGVHIENVICGPGHGVSIGGLGNVPREACVSNVTVTNVTFIGTQNGARIKTWRGGLGAAFDIHFTDLLMINVARPIVLDQSYCDGLLGPSACFAGASNVQLHDISFEGVKGITSSARALYAQCSSTVPCVDLLFRNINLFSPVRRPPAAPAEPAANLCSNAYGTALQIVPWPCLIDQELLPGGPAVMQNPHCTLWQSAWGFHG